MVGRRRMDGKRRGKIVKGKDERRKRQGKEGMMGYRGRGKEGERNGGIEGGDS